MLKMTRRIVRMTCCWLVVVAWTLSLAAAQQTRRRLAEAAPNRPPKTSYEGRGEAATWRREAQRRIDRIRKAKLSIRVVDAEGRPIDDATVHLKMRRHAFGFGSAVVARWLSVDDAAPDGIGFMGHFSRRHLPSPDLLLKRFDRFAKLVPNLQLTELDVDVGNDEALQADYLRDVMTAAFSHEAFQGIVMWGFWEDRHWKPNAALYRRDWSIKPAGRAWLDLVKRKWWTDQIGKTDAHGRYTTRGFLGEYTVTVEHDGAKVEQSLSLSGGGREKVICLDTHKPRS